VIKRQQPLTLNPKNGTGGELSRFPGAGRRAGCLPPIVGEDVDDVEVEELSHQALVFEKGPESPLLHSGEFGFGGDITERLPGRAFHDPLEDRPGFVLFSVHEIEVPDGEAVGSQVHIRTPRPQ